MILETSMSSIVYGDSDFDVGLMLAVHIVEQTEHKIQKDAIHENNQTVVDWVNNARKVINEKQ